MHQKYLNEYIELVILDVDPHPSRFNSDGYIHSNSSIGVPHHYVFSDNLYTPDRQANWAQFSKTLDVVFSCYLLQ